MLIGVAPLCSPFISQAYDCVLQREGYVSLFRSDRTERSSGAQGAIRVHYSRETNWVKLGRGIYSHKIERRYRVQSRAIAVAKCLVEALAYISRVTDGLPVPFCPPPRVSTRD